MLDTRCQAVNDEDINNEDTTDDNELFDKLTKTEFRAHKQAKVVWKQYRMLNLRKKEKELRNFLSVRLVTTLCNDKCIKYN
jgi:hypothetical protein